MVRLAVLIVFFGNCALVASTGAAAQRPQTAIQRAASTKLTEEWTCASNLGAGQKSGRQFCDAIVGSRPEDSIAMNIPAHTGPATLLFDLHPRIQAPPANADPAQVFARHSALVAIVGPTGSVISRAALIREYRTPADLFDRISGTLPGGVKAIAPGQPESIRITIPAGVKAVGIVGVRLDVMTRALRAAYDQPGLPVAIISNARIEYR